MKIICIGRNYSDHAKELNNPVPTKPLFFLKPDSALLIKNKPFYIPEFSNDVHYECELVYKINHVGKSIAEKFAPKYYAEVGLGIDFTARDLQQQCKEKGHPWEIAKAFDNSAVISNFIPLTSLSNRDDIAFKLRLNGETVQVGKSSEMIFNIDKIIAYISQFITLKIGDYIFTGTPAGVGKVSIGDNLEGFIEEKEMFNFEIR